MTTPENDPEAWSAFMCGNAITVGEFAKLITETEEERASVEATKLAENLRSKSRSAPGGS